LDGDDRLHPHFLRDLTRFLREHPEVGLVGCQFEVIGAEGHHLGPGTRSRYAPSYWGWPRALPEAETETPFATFFAATGQGPFALFRVSTLRRTDGYEEDFWSHEDSDIFCQMALLAPVHYLPGRLYLKRVHGNNLTASSRASYAKFRDKWDRMHLSDPLRDRELVRAMHYYYGRHAPLRHFKVALMAAQEFVNGKGWASLRWSLQCFGDGCADLLLQRTLRVKLAQRAAENPLITTTRLK
jgi:GT2 family glycosyltransferase